MKKILVPSDLSRISLNALNLAVEIVEQTMGHIYLVNFHKHPYGSTFTATGEIGKKYSEEADIYNLQLIQKNYTVLSELANKYQSNNVSIEAQIYDEDFDDGMETFIQDNNIDLVVIGTSGEENVQEFFTGNHAQQIIEMAPCPVITVRANDTLGDLKKLVLGVSFDKDAHDNYLRAVGYINDLAASLKAKIHLVHVAHNGQLKAADKKLKKFAEDYGLINYEVAVVHDKNNERGLLSYGHKINAGAVAVLTHADGGFFRVFEDNLSEEMNKHADIPILTVNLHQV